MELDPTEYVKPDDDHEAAEQKRKGRGYLKVKDDNIVQGMQAAQAKSVDDWSYYQARNIRQLMAQSTADTLRAQCIGERAGARRSRQNNTVLPVYRRRSGG